MTVDDAKALGIPVDEPQKSEGLLLLGKLPDTSISLAFLDPQYRALLDKQAYGNEGKQRGQTQCALPQMSAPIIREFVSEIYRVLEHSGHLMLWVDKYILCEGVRSLLGDSGFAVVDMITWNKDRMGMGYRSRRFGEHLVVLQKPPIRAKGVWRVHDIPDVWTEKISADQRKHTHHKPVGLQSRLIEATTNPEDIVLDPAAGGYSVMTAALSVGRHFIGCDLR